MPGPYAKFIIRERGPAGHENLSIELDSSYDERFVGLLKSNLRHGSERHWDGEISKKWYISPAALTQAIEIAICCFQNVTQTNADGEMIDLITGETIPTTMSLFG